MQLEKILKLKGRSLITYGVSWGLRFVTLNTSENWISIQIFLQKKGERGKKAIFRVT